MSAMKLFISLVLGFLSLLWHSILYTKLFKFLSVNVETESTMSSCRDSLGVDNCRPLAYAFLWLMELPSNIVIFGAFSALLVLAGKHVVRFPLNYYGLSLGVASGYFLGVIAYTEISLHYSYYLVSAITYILLLVGSYWCLKHLTIRCSRP